MTKFKKGDLVRCVGRNWKNLVPLGTIGIIKSVDSSQYCKVYWQNCPTALPNGVWQVKSLELAK